MEENISIKYILKERIRKIKNQLTAINPLFIVKKEKN